MARLYGSATRSDGSKVDGTAHPSGACNENSFDAESIRINLSECLIAQRSLMSSLRWAIAFASLRLVARSTVFGLFGCGLIERFLCIFVVSLALSAGCFVVAHSAGVSIVDAAALGGATLVASTFIGSIISFVKSDDSLIAHRAQSRTSLATACEDRERIADNLTNIVAILKITSDQENRRRQIEEDETKSLKHASSMQTVGGSGNRSVSQTEWTPAKVKAALAISVLSISAIALLIHRKNPSQETLPSQVSNASKANSSSGQESSYKSPPSINYNSTSSSNDATIAEIKKINDRLAKEKKSRTTLELPMISLKASSRWRSFRLILPKGTAHSCFSRLKSSSTRPAPVPFVLDS